MIRTISSKSKSISTTTISIILPKANCRNGYCRKVKSAQKELFSSLFPFATKINPTTNEIMTIEPIKGTPIESTLFTSKEKTLEDLQSELINKISNFEDEERIELLDIVQREEDIEEMSPIRFSFEYAMDEEPIEVSKTESNDYLLHLSENHQRPNHVSFIVTDIKNISNDSLTELLEDNLGTRIESSSFKRIQDRTAVGKTHSILASANLENPDNYDKSFYYQRLLNFGIVYCNHRSQITQVFGLKTIEIKISENVDYDFLKKELYKLFEYTTIDSKSIQIQLSEPIYNPFDMVKPKHNGKANIIFASHNDAITAIELLRYWVIDGHYVKPNLSRYIFADNSDSSILLKTLERKHIHQHQDVEIMKKMVDLKEKIELLESNINSLLAIKKKSKSQINQVETPTTQLNQLYN